MREMRRGGGGDGIGSQFVKGNILHCTKNGIKENQNRSMETAVCGCKMHFFIYIFVPIWQH